MQEEERSNYKVILIQDETPLADDWLQAESREGFLDVEDILKDPRTTQVARDRQINVCIDR